MYLYFCYKKTNLNCKCCIEHICKPGSCLCKRCMNLNKEYHELKMYYLMLRDILKDIFIVIVNILNKLKMIMGIFLIISFFVGILLIVNLVLI